MPRPRGTPQEDRKKSSPSIEQLPGADQRGGGSRASSTSPGSESERPADAPQQGEAGPPAPPPPVIINQEDYRAVVIYKALERIATTGTCSVQELQKELTERYQVRDPGATEDFRITSHFITRQLGWLAGKPPEDETKETDEDRNERKRMLRLGLRLDRRILSLDPTGGWQVESHMYSSVSNVSTEKEAVAQEVARRIILEVARLGTPWIYWDAGSTCLASARAISADRLQGWHVMTNNLFLALDLLQRDHPHCYLPAGKPDRHTAAIVKSDETSADLKSWFEKNPPDVAVVSFHWAALENGVVMLGVDYDKEQDSKVEAMRAATEALFIPLTREKLGKKRKFGTVKVRDGKWFDCRSGSDTDLELGKRTRVFFCVDVPEDEPEGDAAKESDATKLIKALSQSDALKGGKLLIVKVKK